MLRANRRLVTAARAVAAVQHRSSSRMVPGLMQDDALSLTPFFWRAERLFPHKKIVTSTVGGRVETSYADFAVRTRKLAAALDGLGVPRGARVGTFAWNSGNHMELWFGVPCSNRVLHTLNIRLFPEQLVYTINHAEDEIVFVDRSLLALFWPNMDKLNTVKTVVVMDDGKGDIPDDPRILHYEDLISAHNPAEFDVTDERAAASMCYTSGTTGNPKGVVYTHRSLFLHTMNVLAADVIGVCETDTVLPVVPMFHANAWGLCHASIAAGSDMILPGPMMVPDHLAKLISDEKVTIAAGVPTIWMATLPHLKGRDTSALRMVACGGSAVSKALSQSYRNTIGLPIFQAWGMTETSPVATACNISSRYQGKSEEELDDLRTSVGVCNPGLMMRIVDLESGEEMPWDGKSRGELQLKGPWVAKDYYNHPGSKESFTADGYLKTGDVAVIEQDGYVRLVDRTKDVIKSGGEWVSSQVVENQIMAHPKVKEAAVVAVKSAKWMERPLACVVPHDGETIEFAELLQFLEPRMAKWWLPDAMETLEEIPKTSVGKFDKKVLRKMFSHISVA